MITFQSIFYKNFLSTGNAGINIQFDEYPTVLVQGMSGSGKSTMIDALCFVLYGKPFRKINKPGLLNSINAKHCIVEVNFETNGIQYQVKRGIKPTIFEIYSNGNLINQDAALKDYQKVLEQQILKMNMKTFTQIAILGSSAYKPFMELPAASRREVIEDILDIGIFTNMNNILKNKIQSNKEELVNIDADIRISKEKAHSLQKIVNLLTTKQEDEVNELLTEIDDISTRKNDKLSLLENINTEIDKLKNDTENHDKIKSCLTKLQNKISEVNTEKRQYKKSIDFFNDNDVCPTCTQNILDEHKKLTINLFQEKITELENIISEYESNQNKIKKKLIEQEEMLNKLNENIYESKTLKEHIITMEKQIEQNENKINEKRKPTEDINETKDELKQWAKKFIDGKEYKKTLIEQQKIYDVSNTLLKDTGIKTAIIKEYLPLINKLLNKYLQDMELFVEFHLDEAFNEIIRSRYRDKFSYGNFSAGEQLRISLAILFTWRHIAKLKNSAACNLLIFDEILTGKLDQSNTEILINLINDIASEGVNIFVIAHGDQLVDKLTHLIKFEKQGDFSVKLC